MQGSSQLSKRAGKSKAVGDDYESHQGRTYRAPRAHIAKVTAKNPGMLTNVPMRAYEETTSDERATLRAMWQAEVKELEKRSEERKKKGKRRCEHSASEEAVSQPAARAGSEVSSGIEFNRRGQRVPEDSPEDVLTGDRDGSEHAKVLVSPISYGRTRALSDEILHRRR